MPDLYKGIGYDDFGFNRKPKKRGKDLFSVKVIDPKTKEVFWEGQVIATSNKNAQKQWRIEYPDVRAKYDSDYCLSICRIVEKEGEE